MNSAVLIAIATITAIAIIAGLVLSIAHRSMPANSDDLVDQVDKLLPQTQCAQCGYPGCRPYAKAIVDNNVAINLCPPGGEETISRLADLLGRDALALAREPAPAGVVAVIDETRCIGCTHCRDVCPVDAIVGAHQFMHTVIAKECTGCELCVAPCPVDCISLVSAA